MTASPTGLEAPLIAVVKNPTMSLFGGEEENDAITITSSSTAFPMLVSVAFTPVSYTHLTLPTKA